MKKLLLTSVFALCYLITCAQIPKFGIKGGVNFADVSALSGSTSISLGSLTTFSVGAFADLKAGAISIQPGLFYTGKGFKSDNLISDESVELDLHYLQVPVNFVYHVPVVVGNIYFGAGPFAAIGINGKAKSTGTDGTAEENVTFGSSENDIKKTEFGFQGIAGFHFKSGFLIGLNYDLGLTDISNNTTEGDIKTRVFGISVGFTF